jgi:colanic acid/amylovoran biosynthesis protein
MLVATAASLRSRPDIRRLGLLNRFSSDRLFSSIDSDEEIAEPFQRATSWRYVFDLAEKLRPYDESYVLGADVLDGHYSVAESVALLDLIGTMASLGMGCRVLGFSFNASPHPHVVAAFRGLPSTTMLCVRDPVSLRRLQGLRLRARSLLVADVAFCLEACSDDPRVSAVSEWAARQRQRQRRILGVNFSSHTLNMFCAASTVPEEEALENVAAGLEQLAVNHDLALALIPHDSRPTRGTGSDAEIAMRVRKRLRTVEDRILPTVVPLSAAAIKYVASLTDLVVTGRMHLAIAALGVGVPPLSVEYQDKFEGLYEHFGFANMTLSPGCAYRRGALYRWVTEHLPELQRYRNQVAARLPAIKELAARNFMS